MNKQIAVIRGDGIGPEIVEQAIRVLEKISDTFGHKFSFSDVDMGGVSIDRHGVPLTEEGLRACMESNSVLLGAVGGPKW